MLGHCPVALAIQRYMGAKDVVVSVDGYVLIEDHKYLSTQRSGDLLLFLMRGNPIAPIEFELTL
jgi:hypothetical protein